MRIVISGTPGSGKSTTAKAIAQKLSLKHFSMGDLQRAYAAKKKISIGELMKLEEADPSIDKEIDATQTKIGKEEDNFIIDGRFSAHFIPHADLKIFLDAKPELRAQRIFSVHRREERGGSWQTVLEQMKRRDASDDKRSQQLYGLTYHDPKLYDYLLDTSELTPEEVTEQVLQWVKQ